MYRSKREVLSSIGKQETVSPSGRQYTTYYAFLGKNPITGKNVRLSKASKGALETTIRKFYDSIDASGNLNVLTESQIADAQNAYVLLAEARLDLSLTDCVKAAIKSGIAIVKSRTSVGKAWMRFYETLAPRSVAYRRSIRSNLTRFVESFGANRPLSDITAAEVKDNLMSRIYKGDRPGTWKTYNNMLGDIKTFMHWCCSKEQGLLAVDPLEGMKKLEIGYRQPEYMKAADTERLFRVLERHKSDAPEDLADAILSFFCGMRTVEIERVREGDEAVRISLDDSFIRVVKCKGSLRGVRPRAFKIPQQAEAWMRSFDFLSAVHAPNPKFRRKLNEYAKEAGVVVPANAGRHTFITMYEAVHHDANSLSAIVGNTEGVRSRSYNGVEVESEGRAYFAILPKCDAGAIHP